MSIRDYISVNPDICHGKPCFKGTRIMVYLVLDMLEVGATNADIQEAYPGLTPQHVKAALEFAHKMSVDSDSVTDAEFATVRLSPNRFHGDWNYAIRPHIHS